MPSLKNAHLMIIRKLNQRYTKFTNENHSIKHFIFIRQNIIPHQTYLDIICIIIVDYSITWSNILSTILGSSDPILWVYLYMI